MERGREEEKKKKERKAIVKWLKLEAIRRNGNES